VNQWLKPRNPRTGSNLVDVGRAAARARRKRCGWRLHRRPDLVAAEAVRKACGVLAATLSGHSWTPILSSGSR